MEYTKRLIEVDLPVRMISRNAAAEMEKRRGHVPMMHIWWAHRPPVACRAILLASILPDPADPSCPAQFILRAKEIIGDYWQAFSGRKRTLADRKQMRQALLDIVATASEYEMRSNPKLLLICRELVRASHPEGSVHLLDPFSGGGIIPFEGVRLGLETTATDLNPVAVLIGKTVIEYIPRYGHALVDHIEQWANVFHQRLRDRLCRFYPSVNRGEKPVAYIWARTVRCEGPNCGVEVPMIRQMWLSRKGNSKAALVIQPHPSRKNITVGIAENPGPAQVHEGTVRGGAVTCPCCGFTTKASKVKSQLSSRNGGANDARLLAVVTTISGHRGRRYREPVKEDLAAVKDAYKWFDAQRNTLLPPDEPLPGKEKHRAVGSQLPLYGFSTWSDLFTKRQLLVLCSLAQMIREGWSEIVCAVKDEGMARAVVANLALLLDKMADMNTSLCVWQTHAGIPAHLFGRKALPMVTDFAEAVPVGESSGTLVSGLNRTLTVLREYAGMQLTPGVCMSADATRLPLPDGAYDICFTDPPYYDSVPYADLSDFFYVWLKRSAGLQFRDLLSLKLTDKEREATVNHPKSEEERQRYTKLLKESWDEARRTLKDNGLLIVVFAHKSTAAWESMMDSLLASNLIITASWPVDTEMRSRMNAKETASLTSSIHLVCRPRLRGQLKESVGDWRDVLAELPKRIHEWLPRLAEEGIVGADAIFACLGPALEIFSRYSQVEKASGVTVDLKEYLEQVWATVAKEALTMIFTGADATGFEEDARLTAMWLWTLKTGDANGLEAEDNEDDSVDDEDSGSKNVAKGGFSLEYDAARKIAQGLGAHLEALQHLVTIQGDTATLLPVVARTRYLFGKDSAEVPKGKTKKKDSQMKLDFGEEIEQIEEESDSWSGDLKGAAGRTILDQLHQGMIFFAAGRTEALRRFLVEEGIGRNPLFWRLAQAFSALYPTGTDEKRWVDGVLARKKNIGF